MIPFGIYLEYGWFVPHVTGILASKATLPADTLGPAALSKAPRPCNQGGI